MNNIVSGEIIGGLGNQLFIIAIVLEYGKRFNKQIVFKDKDINECNIAHEITFLKDLFKNETIIKILNKEEYDNIKFDNIINEEKPYSKTDLEYFEGNVIFKGYFQSPHNFSEEIREKINKYIYMNFYDISIYIYNYIKKNNNDDNDDNYMFIHIRRNDFLYYGLYTDLNYYNKGMEILDGINKKIIIFSDDIEWCKNNIKYNDKQIFIDFINNRYIELILMSLIKNGIVAQESSYSWWGAFLGEKNKKIIVSKERFNNTKILDPNNERYPKEWIII